MLVYKIPLERLALFAANLATCVGAGVELPRALRTSTRSLFSGRLHDLIQQTAERAESGQELSQALRPADPHLPPYFLPVLEGGERTGRLEETLRYLDRHCRMLAEPVRKARNTWLYPLVLFVLGWIVQLLANVVWSPLGVTFGFLLRSAVLYGGGAAVAVTVYRSTSGRLWVDRGRLLVPLLGPIERGLNLHRFFHVLNLLYCTGGMRVEQMIQVASRSVSNRFLREDLLRAVPVIQGGGTVAEAFARCESVEQEFKDQIALGDESGTLEEAFDRIATRMLDGVESRLMIFNRLFYRIVMPLMVFSIALTATSLMRTLMQNPP